MIVVIAYSLGIGEMSSMRFESIETGDGYDGIKKYTMTLRDSRDRRVIVPLSIPDVANAYKMLHNILIKDVEDWESLKRS